jgi:hypothetical protein
MPATADIQSASRLAIRGCVWAASAQGGSRVPEVMSSFNSININSFWRIVEWHRHLWIQHFFLDSTLFSLLILGSWAARGVPPIYVKICRIMQKNPFFNYGTLR